MNKKVDKLHIFALAAHGKGISGGDRIFIELARYWSKKLPIKIYLWKEGREMCARQKLDGKNITFKVSKLNFWASLGFVVGYISRIVEGVILGLTLKIKNDPSTYIYNASEFWMDAFPCILLKIRFPKVTWVATWFQTAPNPLQGFSEAERQKTYNFKAFLYWLVQLPVKFLVKKFADYVLVNNEDEKKRFPKLNTAGKVAVLIGAVKLGEIKSYKKKLKSIPKEYGAVFQGRFHPQKGVVELVNIWKKVTDKLPKAKLAMIGDGPLMKDVKNEISKNKLEKNIKLFGYVFDGEEKYKVFAKSKIVVHPAFYDSGGMASAEAMAFGLPAIGFDLVAYRSYYPKGMIKVKKGDLDAFANAIIDLLENGKKRNKIGSEALAMIEKSWSWETRAEEILQKII